MTDILPTFVDDLTDYQKSWLTQLVARWRKTQTTSMPADMYQSFQTRGWLEGDASSCKLSSEGVGAAMRILGRDVGKTSKLK